MALIKRQIRRLAERTTLGYRLLLTRDLGAGWRIGRPCAPWHNAVLQTIDERNAAIRQAKQLGLPVVNDLPKNWDSLAALDCILANTKPKGKILDAGAELYSMILPWLFLFGYRDLEGINLVFDKNKPVRRGPITYKYGDITRTSYNSNTFDAITCLSVIEHGVAVRDYFREMSRILKPGGMLITSTDYWQMPVDTRGQKVYGVPVHVFTKDEITSFLDIARSFDLILTGPLTLSCSDKVVHWDMVDLDYTFIVFTLRKMPAK